MNWLQKGQQYDSANLEKKVFENVQNIRQSHKHNHENYKKLESRISIV